MPVRVLFLGANPVSRGALDPSAEVQAIRDVLERYDLEDRVSLREHQTVKVGGIASLLEKEKPDILHICCHGDLDGSLVFLQDDSGMERSVSPETFVDYLQAARRAHGWSLKLVVLTACYSTAMAERLLTVADATVGYSGAVVGPAAVRFCGSLYRELLRGGFLKASFDLARVEAVAQGLELARLAEVRVQVGVDAETHRLVEDETSSRLRIEPDDRTWRLHQEMRQIQARLRQLEQEGAAAGTLKVEREKEQAIKRQLRSVGEPQANDTLSDRYYLVDRLGRGGFATVWRAKDRWNQDRLVAVKVLHSQFSHDRSYRERFARGAREMARLQHPHIVKVLQPVTVEGGEVLSDGEVHGGRHYFVMEHLQEDFQQYVISSRPALKASLNIILKVGAALQFAHDRGCIHRDVKPQNLLLTADGDVRLSDFDLARVKESTGGTRTGSLGTVVYSAPECQESAKDADARADVFSLAMTALFAFRGENLNIEVLRDTPGYIKRLSVPAPVKEALVKGLAWEPAQRYPSVADFCDALERAFEARSRRAMPGLASALLVVTGIAGYVGFWRGPDSAPSAPALHELSSTAPRAGSTPGRATPILQESPAPIPDTGTLMQQATPAPAPGTATPTPRAAPSPEPVVASSGRQKFKPPTRVDATSTKRPSPPARVITASEPSKQLKEVPDVKPEAASSCVPRKYLDAACKPTGDWWIPLPGGTFMMGDDNSVQADERPAHKVSVSAFSMSKTEVTVAQYRACVDAKAKGCTTPDTGEFCNWDKAGREDHPINCVDWNQASAFAAWLGGRLPREAEWEFAARATGTEFGKERTYPWAGDAQTSCQRVVMFGCTTDGTRPVCSTQDGNTPEGLCDMAGNVWEWVADWYGPYPAASAQVYKDPAGPDSGSYRVLRGGSWFDVASSLRGAFRFRVGPSNRLLWFGFRVVLPAARGR